MRWPSILKTLITKKDIILTAKDKNIIETEMFVDFVKTKQFLINLEITVI